MQRAEIQTDIWVGARQAGSVKFSTNLKDYSDAATVSEIPERIQITVTDSIFLAPVLYEIGK